MFSFPYLSLPTLLRRPLLATYLNYSVIPFHIPEGCDQTDSCVPGGYTNDSTLGHLLLVYVTPHDSYRLGPSTISIAVVAVVLLSLVFVPLL